MLRRTLLILRMFVVGALLWLKTSLCDPAGRAVLGADVRTAVHSAQRARGTPGLRKRNSLSPEHWPGPSPDSLVTSPATPSPRPPLPEPFSHSLLFPNCIFSGAIVPLIF